MSATAHNRAERCFALARSTTFAGERDNAIAQGIRIADAAGLSLDLFDIPGRQRPTASHAGFRYTEYSGTDLGEALRRFKADMNFASYAEAAFAQAGIRAGETIAEAQKRMFEDAVSEAKQRDATRAARDNHRKFEEAQRRARAGRRARSRARCEERAGRVRERACRGNPPRTGDG